MDNLSKHIANIRHRIASMGNTDTSRNSNASIYKPKYHINPIEPKLDMSLDELEKMYSNVFLRTLKIETERLIIRRLCIHDAQDIYDYSKDSRVAEHVIWSVHKSIAQSVGYIRYLQAQYRSGLPASMGILEKSTNKIIGTIGFMKVDIENSSAEIGYSLRFDRWNKGYMTEALSAMLKFGFLNIGLNRIEAFCEISNPASARVLEKVGMQFEGIVRQKYYNKNKFVDVKQYAILFYDYKKEVKYEI